MGKTLETITEVNKKLVAFYDSTESGAVNEIIKKLLFAGKEIVIFTEEYEVNDNLIYWSDLLDELVGKGFEKKAYNHIISQVTCFIYILSKELLASHSGSMNAYSALSQIEEAKELIKNYDLDLFEDIKNYCDCYDDVMRFKLLEDRIFVIYEKSLKSRFDSELGRNKEDIFILNEKIEKNKELLESIESKSAFTSLLSGFDRYSESIENKLSWVSREVKTLKMSMITVPIAGLFYSFSSPTDIRVYVGLFSLLVVLGLLLRFSARKEDQMEQLLSNINTRTSLAVFHKYQLNDMDESEKFIANERFQSFIYSEIKTSDWHAPDISASIAEIIKAARK